MAQLPFKLPQMNLGPRTRMILRYVGFAVFAIVVFVFALQATFPYNRLKNKLIEAAAEKYEITIGSVDPGILPGNVTFNAVSIRTRPDKPGETATTFFIKSVDLDLGILPLLGGTIDLELDAAIGAGSIEAEVALAKFGRGTMDLNIVGEDLPAANLPMRAALGLPMSGKINFGVDLHLPVEKAKTGKTAINWKTADGVITVACPGGCTFGDGTTKLKPLLKNTRNQVMVGEGIDFGKVALDRLAAKVTLKKGKLTVDKFDTASKDGELHVDYTMTLEKEFGQSVVAGCLRFKGSDDLLKREPKTFAALQTTGAELRSDGLFHIRLTGTFKNMKRLNQQCGPGLNAGDKDEFDTPDRPNLTVTPQPDSTTGGSDSPPAISAPPPPPAGEPGPEPEAATGAQGSPGVQGSQGTQGDGAAPGTPTPATPPTPDGDGAQSPPGGPLQDGQGAANPNVNAEGNADGNANAPMEPPPPGAATPAMPPPEE